MMANLLPKRISCFSKEDYWNHFFLKRGDSAFEWYGEYSQLSRLLHKYIRPSDKLLVLGCGNSSLSADLYDAGFHNNVSIDISNVVIKQMKEKYTRHRPGLEFVKMDMLQMSFEDEQFNVALDKGTLDALMSEGTDECSKKASQMFSEIKRTLKFCGRYVCISLLQDYIFKKLLTWFIQEGWMVRIHRCPEIEEDPANSKKKIVFPVFVIVCTKMKISQEMKLSTELDMDGNIVRVDCFDNVFSTIKAVQEYNMYRHYIQNNKLLKNEVVLELCGENSDHPRYTLHIFDQENLSANKYAIFIVPQGRETEWLFATSEGRRQLIESAGCERLVVVHLNRHHSYADLEEIKSELSSKVMEYAPLNFNSAVQVPFLSVGADIGKRTICCSGKSKISGNYVVEDVEDEGKVSRRLLFYSNQNTIQSEGRLKKVTKKKNKKGKQIKWEIDHSYLCCQHHNYMAAGLFFLPEDKRELATVLVIGLGGGGLPMFLRHHWSKASIEVVELDPEIGEIATKWFGLSIDERLKLHIADGIEFAIDCIQKGVKFDIVMVDVDNKDIATGLTSPPKSFIEVSFLQQLSQVLSIDGVLVLNIACRNLNLKEEIYSNLKTTFGEVFLASVTDEINEIIFALPRTVRKENMSVNIEDSFCSIMNKLELSSKDNMFSARDFIKGLRQIK